MLFNLKKLIATRVDFFVSINFNYITFFEKVALIDRDAKIRRTTHPICQSVVQNGYILEFEFRYNLHTVASVKTISPVNISGRVKFVKANRFNATKLIITVVLTSFAK